AFLMSVTYTASGTGPDGAEAGKAVISVSGNTMTITLTSLTPDAASDGQNLSSLEFLFAAAPPTVSSLTAAGQLIKVNADGTWSDVSGAITHWGTAAVGNSLYLATAGTGSTGGT